ncbi:MAG TPA: ATP-binding protein [Polyangiaceae bacterium]|nr:ATP-binding protein [Polyangiaceae bacterium]
MSNRRLLGFRSLSGRVSAWIAVTMLATMSVFAVVSYWLLTAEEVEETSEPPDEVAADVRKEILSTMGLVAPFAVLFVTGGTYVLARRVMRPLDQVIRRAQRMAPRDLHRRLELPANDDELRALVETLNGLFGRLEAGFAAQSSFAFDVSHELRTPLAVVTAELEIALRRPRTEEEWRASAHTVLAEARKATRLVDTLLRHARAGLEPREHTSLDLQELAESVVDAQVTLARQAGLSLRLSPKPAASGSARASGDAAAIEAAISSVVGNAIRYTPAGGRVELSAEAASDGVRLHIDDTGPGVDVAEREAIFAAFVRGAAGRRLDEQGAEAGAGLGLALARRIVQAHHGSLDAHASPLGGARFTFCFPALEQASANREPNDG